jgi:hypothetical protein
MIGVSMYVGLLTRALDSWTEGVSGPTLVDYVLVCRSNLLSHTVGESDGAYSLLAAEIAYDRALIKLCDERGVITEPTRFSVPPRERTRLEVALTGVGVNLTASATST